jgi:hypothetical protein
MTNEMPSESPLNMMRPPAQRMRRPEVRPAARRGRWPILATLAIVVVLAIAWGWLWYYAATIADRTMAAWVDREAAAGRVYSCGTQTIGGFPFGISASCVDAGAEIKNNVPPFAVKAKSVVFAAEIYHPTRLTGDITGPLTVAPLGQPPSFLAVWSRARVSVRGVPPDPEGVSAELDDPQISAVGNAQASGGVMLFKAKRADFQGRVIGGSPRSHPVIGAILRLTAATAPTTHPILAQPIDLEIDAVLRGLKDLAPKPWPERFREIQAAGGGIEIKSLQFTQGGAHVAGKGTLNVNDHGRVDGLISVAVVGLEQIVPLLGVDRMIAQGIDRLSGTEGSTDQGLNALDRLVPGLGNAIRDSANASVIDSVKRMGQPTTIDGQPATLLPLRFVDGAIYLGMLRVGEVPPLY